MRTLLALPAAALALALALAATVIAPCAFRDAPVPARAQPWLEAGRRSIAGHVDWFPWPLHVQFVEARCTEDEVVLLYAQRQVPYLETRYGFKRAGAGPTGVGSDGGHSWDWDALMASEEMADVLARATACE